MENPPIRGSLDDVPTCPNGYDPIDNEALRDPWADPSELRDLCPVSKVQTGGVDVVVVTRFDDVAAVERNHHAFGNIGHHPHPDAVAGRPPSEGTSARRTCPGRPHFAGCTSRRCGRHWSSSASRKSAASSTR